MPETLAQLDPHPPKRQQARQPRAPDDRSVVGFDDIPIASQVAPPLTTLRQPLVDKGRIAAELLFGRRRADAPILLPTELVVRGTTAPPRQS
jgi:DNA-binding LacI/PurR family transcriptional regulator